MFVCVFDSSCINALHIRKVDQRSNDGFYRFEQVELTNNNLDILTNKEEYFFLIDDRITPFQNGSFYLRGNPISIDLAYSIGGIHIIKKTTLE